MKETSRTDRSGADTISALTNAARLCGDDRFQELAEQTWKDLSRTTHDVVERFREAGFSISDMTCAVSYALMKILARLERDVRMTPEDLGRLTANALREERKRKSMEQSE